MDPKSPALKSANDILSGYNMKIDEIESIWESEFEIPPEIKRHLETECKYRVYLDKQEKVISWFMSVDK